MDILIWNEVHGQIIDLEVEILTQNMHKVNMYSIIPREVSLKTTKWEKSMRM